MAKTEEELQAAAALLRQLWLGLSSYRLYPGSTDRPGFTAAADRIAVAALKALVPGPVDVEIRGDQCLLGGDLVPTDDSVQRLALACFERRVERLMLHAVPSVSDLDKLYRVLSTPADQLVVAGGPEMVLRQEGAVSVSLSTLGPPQVEGADHFTDDLPSARPAVDAELLPSRPTPEGAHGSQMAQAEVLLAQLRSIAAGVNPDTGERVDARSSGDAPPSGLQPPFVEALVDRIRDDPMTRRLIGTMNNAELTRTLVNLGEVGGGDPVKLAEALAAAGVRHVDVVDLTAALRAGREEAGTIIAGLERLGIDVSHERPGSSPGSVTEALSDYLIATRPDDVRAMRSAIAQSEREHRSSALLALRDYLTLEPELERVGEVLDVWAHELNDAVRQGDAPRIQVLLPPVHRALAGTSAERSMLFETYTRQTLDREAVTELFGVDHESAGSSPEEVISPFGDLGVDVLLDMLEEEQDRDRRARLFGVLRRIVPSHTRPVVRRLKDPRWYVVRNAVALLGAAGGTDNLERLADAAGHASPEVRREATAALVAAGGTASVPLLRRLLDEGPEDAGRAVVGALGTLAGPEAGAALADIALSAPHRAVRELALDWLARQSGDRELLSRLGSRRSRPRLPWRLRRRARKLAGRSGGAGR